MVNPFNIVIIEDYRNHIENLGISDSIYLKIEIGVILYRIYKNS